MAVPSHRSASGREGYRTPTIDDDERHARGIQPEHDGNGPFPRASTHTRLHSQCNSPLDGTNNEHSHSRTETVMWKERVRQFTWTFFTMTMATGGVASVLHTGSDLHSYLRC